MAVLASGVGTYFLAQTEAIHVARVETAQQIQQSIPKQTFRRMDLSLADADTQNGPHSAESTEMGAACPKLLRGLTAPAKYELQERSMAHLIFFIWFLQSIPWAITAKRLILADRLERRAH